MNKWNDYFQIVQKENLEDRAHTSMWMFDEYYRYELVDPDGNIVATYKDHKYAKKQAKYKFKNMMAKLEKILLA